jgi:hypothetical protein
MGFLTPELKSEFGKVLLAVILQLKEQLEKKDGDRS